MIAAARLNVAAEAAGVPAVPNTAAKSPVAAAAEADWYAAALAALALSDWLATPEAIAVPSIAKSTLVPPKPVKNS